MCFSAEYLDKVNLRIRRDAKPSDDNDDNEYELENENSDRPKSDSINHAADLQNAVKELNYDIK